MKNILYVVNGVLVLSTIILTLGSCENKTEKKEENSSSKSIGEIVDLMGKNTRDSLKEIYKDKFDSVEKDAVIRHLKDHPEKLDEIANSDENMNKAKKEVYGKLKLNSFLTQNSIDGIETTLGIELNKNRVDYIIEDIDDYLDVLTKMPQRGYNDELDGIIKRIKDKKKLAIDFKEKLANTIN